MILFCCKFSIIVTQCSVVTAAAERDLTVVDDDNKSNQTSSGISEPVRLTHQQRVMFKEKTAKMEAKVSSKFIADHLCGCG